MRELLLWALILPKLEDVILVDGEANVTRLNTLNASAWMATFQVLAN